MSLNSVLEMTFRSARPGVPFANHKRRGCLKEIQPLPSQFVLHPLPHHSQSRIPIPLRNLQTKYQSELPPRVHLTEHLEWDVVGTIEVRTLEDQDDFGEQGRFDCGDDIPEEVWGTAGLGHGGRRDLERSKGPEVR